jgi:prephenate dehydratase
MNKIRLGLLGPDGTFTAEAGINYSRRSGITPEIRWYNTIEDCFDGVESDDVDRSIVPMLNSTGRAAWVNETLKKLRESGALICDEEIIPITLNLAALPGTTLGDIRYFHSKDKALQQCSIFLSTLTGVELVNEASTANAAANLRNYPDYRQRAAVVPLRAAEMYGLSVLEKGIQDEKGNKTKFIVISKQDHEPTGNDKTTVIFEFKDVNRPCLLYHVIKEFAERGISLGYIQSIPKDSKLDEFTFYMDIIGHRKNRNIGEALTALERNADILYCRILGSYPVFKE